MPPKLKQTARIVQYSTRPNEGKQLLTGKQMRTTYTDADDSSNSNDSSTCSSRQLGELYNNERITREKQDNPLEDTEEEEEEEEE